MLVWWFVIVGALLILMALLAAYVERLPLSAAVLYLAIGYALGLPAPGMLQVDVLADAGALPRLVRHDSFDWHLHAVPADAPLPTRITVETAMAMMDVVRSDEMSRLGICADDGCEGLVVDLSKNRSRRYCEGGCAARAHTAAYRARKSIQRDT